MTLFLNNSGRKERRKRGREEGRRGDIHARYPLNSFTSKFTST